VTLVYDIDEQGDVVERRAFEIERDAVDHARDRVPVGAAFAVKTGRRLAAHFGSKPALRIGGWL
jgi:hypothetical protein